MGLVEEFRKLFNEYLVLPDNFELKNSNIIIKNIFN